MQIRYCRMNIVKEPYVKTIDVIEKEELKAVREKMQGQYGL